MFAQRLIFATQLGLVGLLCVSQPNRAHAGGLYLLPRGTEPAARGGARVAGSDDPHALWYNPAGLVYSGKQLLGDLTMPFVQTEFTRYSQDGAGKYNASPTADAPSARVPIPTLAYSDSLGLRRWGFGVGLIVPSAYAPRWPSQVAGQRAPQRYSILDADGSIIATLALGAAYRPIDQLSIGTALYLTAAQVGATVAVSACDYAVCQQPEAREWEGQTRFLLGPRYSATAVFGAIGDFGFVRVGASVQVRTKISGVADFDVKLPDQAIFDDVKLENAKGGTHLKANMAVTLPTIMRMGVEVRPLKPLRVEVGTTWERWSVQDSITVKPRGVFARDVPTLGDIQMQPVSLARNMKDTWAVNVGGSYDLSDLVERKLLAHGGFMFETSAFSARDLSPTTIDTNKVLLGAGATVELWPTLLLDVAFGHVFMRNQTVTNSRVLLPTALQPVPTDSDPTRYVPGNRPAIGNGKYVVEANFVGLGLRWLLDAPH